MRPQPPLPLRVMLSLAMGAFVTAAVPSLAAADLVPDPTQVTDPTPAPEKVFSEKDRKICDGKQLGDTCTAQSGGAGTCQSRACRKTIPQGDAGATIISGTCVVCADLTNDRAPIPGGDLAGGSCAVSSHSPFGYAVFAMGFLGAASIGLGARRSRRNRK